MSLLPLTLGLSIGDSLSSRLTKLFFFSPTLSEGPPQLESSMIVSSPTVRGLMLYLLIGLGRALYFAKLPIRA